ncbi:MAG: Lrp/AsnC family transcriptional regulator [Parvularculaceae bacterium]
MAKAGKDSFNLDGFDYKILDLLQVNNQRTSEELAELVCLSPTSCLRRVKALREAKVITADVSIVSPKVIGARMTMIVLVALEREQRVHIEEFKASMRANPRVTQCYYVTGTVDFMLIVSVKDMEEYEMFTREFFFENRNVKRFETLVVMGCSKFDISVRASMSAPADA